jgi:hypothetical protein
MVIMTEEKNHAKYIIIHFTLHDTHINKKLSNVCPWENILVILTNYKPITMLTWMGNLQKKVYKYMTWISPKKTIKNIEACKEGERSITNESSTVNIGNDREIYSAREKSKNYTIFGHIYTIMSSVYYHKQGLKVT